jgi:hypothetical protein
MGDLPEEGFAAVEPGGSSVAVEPPSRPQAAAEVGEVTPCHDPLGDAAAAPIAEPPPLPAEPAVGVPQVRDVHDLDWTAIARAVDPSAVRSRMRVTVVAMETLLDVYPGPGLLFDGDRSGVNDRAIQIDEFDAAQPLWIIGDLHGDLLTLESALALIDGEISSDPPPRLVFLGDLFDDEGLGLETLLRVFELILARPGRICLIAGNHDEALSYDGSRFASSVSPGDFAEFLNENLAHEWIVRAGKVAVRLIAGAPRALFFPDGLLVAHAGFPLVDLHPSLAESGNWNDPRCLADFAWTRAHPTARRKMPNRYTRGSQFGHEDFAAFCDLSTGLGRPVTHMVRGHDHVDDRFAIYPAYRKHPILTTVAMSRRLPRESFGPRARAPTVALYQSRSLPQVHRLHIPADLIEAIYPSVNEAADGPVREAQS